MSFSHHLQTDREEHPFAEFIRILGKGKKGSRALTQEEAHRAMGMILADEVLPEQLGAFLMLMRVKEETAEELAGFVQAAREFCTVNAQFDISSPLMVRQAHHERTQFSTVRPEPVEGRTYSTFVHQNSLADLDWSTYAGKRRHLPWFILAALSLAENGFRIFMHGAEGPSSSRLYTETALSSLGIHAALTADEVKTQLQQQNFSYIALRQFCPVLQKIIDLRPILGLRSPVHTIVRMLNPMQAACTIQGIFHPSYRSVHQNAAVLLGDAHMAVLKGEGGETERNPDMDCLVQSVHGGELSEEVWPALFTQRHVRAESLQAENLVAVWQGKTRDEYAEASVTGTVAVALKLLDKADSQRQAHEMALELWLTRNKNRFG